MHAYAEGGGSPRRRERTNALAVVGSICQKHDDARFDPGIEKPGRRREDRLRDIRAIEHELGL